MRLLNANVNVTDSFFTTAKCIIMLGLQVIESNHVSTSSPVSWLTEILLAKLART